MRFVFEWGRFPHVHKEEIREFSTVAEALAYAVQKKASHAFDLPDDRNPGTIYTDRPFRMSATWALKYQFFGKRFYLLMQYIKMAITPWKWGARLSCHGTRMPCQYVDDPNDNHGSFSDA